MILAGLLFIAGCFFSGAPETWAKQPTAVPYAVQMLSDGLERLPRYFLALTGAIIAIGASLGAPDVLTSVKKSAAGSVAAISVVMLATGWTYSATSNDMTQGMSDGNAIGLIFIVIVTLAFAIAAIKVVLLTWAPVAIAAIATSIVLHGILNHLNGLPMPWELQDGETEIDSNRVVFELGSIAAVFAVLAAAYGFLPGFQMTRVGLASDSSPEAVLKTMPSGRNGQPDNATAKGRLRIEQEANELQKLAQDAIRNRCSFDDAKRLRVAINDYFRNLKRYEDWKPGQELTAPSKRVLETTKAALGRNLISWSELRPYSRLHLDDAQYAAVQYEYPADCP